MVRYGTHGPLELGNKPTKMPRKIDSGSQGVPLRNHSVDPDTVRPTSASLGVSVIGANAAARQGKAWAVARVGQQPSTCYCPTTMNHRLAWSTLLLCFATHGCSSPDCTKEIGQFHLSEWCAQSGDCSYNGEPLKRLPLPPSGAMIAPSMVFLMTSTKIDMLFEIPPGELVRQGFTVFEASWAYGDYEVRVSADGVLLATNKDSIDRWNVSCEIPPSTAILQVAIVGISSSNSFPTMSVTEHTPHMGDVPGLINSLSTTRTKALLHVRLCADSAKRGTTPRNPRALGCFLKGQACPSPPTPHSGRPA